MVKQIVINDLCDYFMQVGWSCEGYDLQIGEVFCGSKSPELKTKLGQKQCRYVEQIHKNTIEVFKNSLETEMWQVSGLLLILSIAIPNEVGRDEWFPWSSSEYLADS